MLTVYDLLRNGNSLCEPSMKMDAELAEKLTQIYNSIRAYRGAEFPLIVAASEGYERLVWGFLECAILKDTDLHTVAQPLDLQNFLRYTDNFGQTALYWAAYHNKLKVVQMLLQYISIEHLTSYRDPEHGHTPISWLRDPAYDNHIFEKLKAAAGRKVDPGSSKHQGDSQDHSLKLEVDPQASTSTTILDKEHGYMEQEMAGGSYPKSHVNEMQSALDLLDEGKCELTPNKNTILHLVSKFGDVGNAKSILEKHPSLMHRRNSEGETAFYVAAREGHIDILKILINSIQRDEIKLELATRSKDKHTALHIAIENHHAGVVFLLVKEIPKLANCINCFNESPLFFAVERGYFHIFRLLLDECSEIAFEGTNGATALHAAVFQAQAAASAVIQAQAAVLQAQAQAAAFQAQAAVFQTQAQAAVFQAQAQAQAEQAAVFQTQATEFIQNLLCKKIDLLRDHDNNGWTPLHYAVCNDMTAVIEELLKKDPNSGYQMTKTYGRNGSAIHFAVSRGYRHQIITLLSHCPGCLEITDSEGKNVLHVAIESNRIQEFYFFLNGYKSVTTDLINQRDNNGNTPFHLLAASDYQTNLMAIEYRANLYARNKQFLTPLDMASSEEKRMKYIKAKEEAVKGIEEIRKVQMEVEQKEEEEKEKEKNKKKEQEEREKKEQDKIKEKQKQWITKIGDNVIIVVTLIATATFAAAFTVPGGYDGNEGSSKEGMPILLRKALYKAFVIANGLAFACSCCALFGYVRLQLYNLAYEELAEEDKEGYANIISLLYLLTGIAMIAMAVAFVTGTYVILTPSLALAIFLCATCVCIIGSFSFFPAKRLGFATSIISYYIRYHQKDGR